MNITFLGNFGVPFSSETHHANTLVQMGHKVTRIQEGRSDSDLIFREVQLSDLFIWIHTHGWDTPGIEEVLKACKTLGIPSLTYHLDLWMGLDRQKDMLTEPYWQIGHFFTVDKLMADYLNVNTNIKGHYIHAGVYQYESFLHSEYDGETFDNDIIFVGSKGYHPEWPYRKQLIEWLEDTYKDQFKHYGGDGLGVVRGEELNRLYAKSKIVIGDSACLGFDYPYYWSDRVYETTGRGGFIIHPEIKGLEQDFIYGLEIETYKFGDFAGLEAMIEFYLKYNGERENIRLNGFNKTHHYHTYTKRWEKILKEVASGT